MKEIFGKMSGLRGGDQGGAYTWFGVKKELLIRLVLAVILFVAGLVLSAKGNVALLLMLAAFLVSGYDVIVRAIVRAANERRFSEELLITLAGVLAFVISAGYEAAAVMIIYQLGHVLRSYALELTKGALRERIDPYPTEVNVLRGEDKFILPADEVQVDDILVVAEGERFPVDCEVTMGSSYIDLSAVLGHEEQREVSEGMYINAGAVNLNSELRVRAIRTFADSTVVRAAQIASNGNDVPSAAQSGAERYASLFAPFVLGIGIIITLVLLIFTETGTEEAIHRGLVMLIIACPTAILACIPFTYLSGLYRSLSQGVLVKNAALLDSLSRIGAVIFDKDDLLSGDDLRVAAVKSQRLEPDVLLKVAAHAASNSTDKRAAAIVSAYRGVIDNSLIQRFEEFETGIAAVIDGVVITMGDREFMDRLGVAVPEEEADGQNVFMALNGNYAGSILLADSVRGNVGSSVAALEAIGCDCIMLSADSEESTGALAADAGIREYYAQCMPIDRLEKIQEIKERFPKSTVLYIGDGTADNSSMDAADIGVCINGVISPKAITNGEVVVMDSSVDAICNVVDTARVTRKTVRLALLGMIGVKLLLLLLSVFGLTYQMWFAAMVDMIAGVAAILFSTSIWSQKQ